MTKEALLDYVNTYLADGTPADALERLTDLLQELEEIRQLLLADAGREENPCR